MDFFVPGIVFVISVILLVWSGGILVRTLSRIAAFLEIPEYIVAFILMGFATSAPEIMVSIFAAIRGDSIIAFGNTIGSNIFYPTILIGLVAILARKIIVRPSLLKRENLYASIIALLPFVFLLDFRIDRFEGLILAGVFIIYIGSLLTRRRFSRTVANQDSMIDGDKKSLRMFFANISFFIVGLAILLISSEGVVRSAVSIAEIFEMPLFIISIILIAGGVALPELAFSLRAVMAGKTEMVLGNMFGSIATNSGLALGLAAFIQPVVLENHLFVIVGGAFALSSLALFAILSYTRTSLSWREGMILVAVYIGFIVTMLAIVPKAL